MKSKYNNEIKQKAIELRKSGLSLSEISKELNIPERTIGTWVKFILLTDKEKKLLASRGGKISSGIGNIKKWEAVRKDLYTKAIDCFKNITLDNNSLALIGAALYWTEGSKGCNTFTFTNSDIDMVKLYIRWLNECLLIQKEAITCSLSVYLNNNISYTYIQDLWEKELGLTKLNFRKPTILENTKEKNFRKNIHKYGIIRIEIKKPCEYKAKLAILLSKIGKHISYVERT